MATLPVQRTWTVGEKVTAAMLNGNVRDAVNFFVNAPACLAFNGAIAVAHATITYFTYASERYDNDNIHSTTTNTARLTCVTAGVYDIASYAEFAASAGGSERTLLVRVNGGAVIRRLSVPKNGGAATWLAFSFPYKLAVNDYLELGCWQDSGGALNVTPEFGMTWASSG